MHFLKSFLNFLSSIPLVIIVIVGILAGVANAGRPWSLSFTFPEWVMWWEFWLLVGIVCAILMSQLWIEHAEVVSAYFATLLGKYRQRWRDRFPRQHLFRRGATYFQFKIFRRS